HKVIFSETATPTGEQPDAIGWRWNGYSTLIECKISESDFYSDQKKRSRRDPSVRMGSWCYYLTPASMLSPNARQGLNAKGWGLLEVHGRMIRTIYEAPYVESRCSHREVTMLVCGLWRLQESLKARGISDPLRRLSWGAIQKGLEADARPTD
ncbi:MAG: hypothetical protein ACRDQZ_13515, partial [Mycobacteriales bacterium]